MKTVASLEKNKYAFFQSALGHDSSNRSLQAAGMSLCQGYSRSSCCFSGVNFKIL